MYNLGWPYVILSRFMSLALQVLKHVPHDEVLILAEVPSMLGYRRMWAMSFCSEMTTLEIH